MDLIFFFKGLLLGFSVAAPVGPIGILCINRTITKNFSSGFVSGLGAATADLVYGIIAGLGLTVISNFLIEQKLWFQIIGLTFLFYLGIKTLLKKESGVELKDSSDKGLLSDYLSTFVLTITNPITILIFMAVLASLGLSNSKNGSSSIIQMILGVFMGSTIWWFILSGITQKLKKRIGKNILKRIDLVSGLLILFFGVLILLDLIKGI